jgi:omega-6 fatty acid desaturase (delta-12 desaturase)
VEQAQLYKELRRYALAERRRSLAQVSTTLAIYLAAITVLVILLYYGIPSGVIVLLSLLISPIVVKTFIIFHDCCHQSYFKSRKACFWLGHALGILTFTAYLDWQRTHGIHHRFMANLERRGTGDVWLMTVDEYHEAERWTKLRYRLYRHPLFIFFVSSPFLFLILNRFPSRGFRRKELYSTLFTDVMLVLIMVCISLFIGWKVLLLIVLPMMLGASMLGVWLFYVQHQFRRVYWAHNEDWDRYRAAMEGSSFYMMPAFLRWLSGNIGYHHIHHLAPQIPNYRLKECFDEIEVLQQIDPVPYLSGLRNICLSLWDEKSGRLVTFEEARTIVGKA